MGRRAAAAWTAVAVLLAGAAHARARATAWTPKSFPNPNTDPRACGRGNAAKSSICDPDGVMSPDAADLAEGLLSQVRAGQAPYAQAPCGAGGAREGFQIAVALMQRMRLGAAEAPADAAAAFARDLHDAWGVGSSACDNGVVLLLSTRDRQMYVSTGLGAEAAGLDRAAVLRVLSNMKPALREGRYDDAVLEAVHELGLVLAGAPLPDPSHGGGGGGGGDGEGDDDGGWGVFAFFSAVVAAVFGWGWWSNRKQAQRFKACQTKLEALKRDQAAAARGQRYDATSCPICLEHFAPTGAAAASAANATSAAAAATELVPVPLASVAEAVAVGSMDSGVTGGSGAAAGPSSRGEAAPLLGRGGGSFGAGSSGSGGVGRTPLVLRCGHQFCGPCISEWCRAHTTCPVCRRDIDGADDAAAAAAGAPPGPCSAQDANAGAGAARRGGAAFARARRDDADFLLPELAFRARRLGLLYPDFVTDAMVMQFEQDVLDRRELSPAALASFDARHPLRESAARRAELRESGHAGAVSSFGGGRSGGGGGAGSSW